MGVGECAGSVQDNPIASSLLQNKSDAKVIEIIFCCEKKNCNTKYLTAYKVIVKSRDYYPYYQGMQKSFKFLNRTLISSWTEVKKSRN